MEVGRYRDAVSYFDRAIALRPRFARAYASRGEATFLAGTPQTSLYPSLTALPNLQASNRDTERALELGDRDPDIFLSLGFGRFEEHLLTGDAALLDASIDATRRAVRADPGDAVATFNLGVALLAARRVPEAQSTYAAAMQKVMRQDAADRVDIVAGALTDLELLHKYRKDSPIAGIKRYVVSRLISINRRSSASLGDFELAIYPSYVSYLVHDEHRFRPARDALVLVWYHRDRKLGWSVLSEVSGPAGRAESDYKFDAYTEKRYQVVAYLQSTSPPKCLPPGTYRLEAYLNGRLVSRRSTEADFQALHAAWNPDLRFLACLPAGWRRGPQLPGVMASWLGSDRLRGVALFRIARPFADTPTDMDAKRLINDAIRAFPKLFPGPLETEAIDENGSFSQLDSAVRRTFMYRDRKGHAGAALAGAGFDSDWTGWVGVVFGPGDYVLKGNPGFDVFMSLTRQ